MCSGAGAKSRFRKAPEGSGFREAVSRSRFRFEKFPSSLKLFPNQLYARFWKVPGGSGAADLWKVLGSSRRFGEVLVAARRGTRRSVRSPCCDTTEIFSKLFQEESRNRYCKNWILGRNRFAGRCNRGQFFSNLCRHYTKIGQSDVMLAPSRRSWIVTSTVWGGEMQSCSAKTLLRLRLCCSVCFVGIHFAKAGSALGAVTSLARLTPPPTIVLVCSDVNFYRSFSARLKGRETKLTPFKTFFTSWIKNKWNKHIYTVQILICRIKD